MNALMFLNPLDSSQRFGPLPLPIANLHRPLEIRRLARRPKLPVQLDFPPHLRNTLVPDKVESFAHRDGVRAALRIRPFDLDNNSSLASHPKEPSRHAPNVLGNATPLGDSDDNLVEVGEE